MDMRSMYQEIVLEHNKNPRNFGKIDPYNKEQLGHNPLCGDKIIMFSYIQDDKLVNISFDGEGCAISKSSASLLTEAVKNKPLEEVRYILSCFEKMLLEPSISAEEEKTLHKLIVFQGVKNYPARVKCALLSCRTLQAILNDRRDPISSE